MPKTKLSIPLNDGLLSILRAGVEVSYEPPGVNTRRLLVLLVYRNVGGSKADSSPDGVPPPVWRHRPRNWHAVDGETKDHGDILQHHRGLPTQKVERVGLHTPPVHKCHQRGGVHHRQSTGDEASKRQERRTSYERRVPLVPQQGAMRADPKRGQSLWNTTIVQKYYLEPLEHVHNNSTKISVK
jgi:hypothetical protein